MRRAELVACVAVLALSGCMKIYPDPELPDVVVEWFGDDCTVGAIVAVSLIGVDSPATREDVDVPCEAQKYTFVDVARERFNIEGAMLEDTGEVLSNSSADVDLRHGLDDTVELFFSVDFANFRAAWTFDMGATCESLAADSVSIRFAYPGELLDSFGWDTSCVLGMYRGYAPNGQFKIRLVATSVDTPVAASPYTPELMISSHDTTDIGTLVMSPCSGECM